MTVRAEVGRGTVTVCVWTLADPTRHSAGRALTKNREREKILLVLLLLFVMMWNSQLVEYQKIMFLKGLHIVTRKYEEK